MADKGKTYACLIANDIKLRHQLIGGTIQSYNVEYIGERERSK